MTARVAFILSLGYAALGASLCVLIVALIRSAR